MKRLFVILLVFGAVSCPERPPKPPRPSRLARVFNSEAADRGRTGRGPSSCAIPHSAGQGRIVRASLRAGSRVPREDHGQCRVLARRED
jgi:hypothetical protein